MRPVPFESVMMSIAVEQQKKIMQLEEDIKMLKK
jgi:hypothetical protein